MNEELKSRITDHLREAQYTEDQIERGISYADQIGYNNDDEALSLVMSRILYSDSDLEYGERFAVDPGSW